MVTATATVTGTVGSKTVPTYTKPTSQPSEKIFLKCHDGSICAIGMLLPGQTVIHGQLLRKGNTVVSITKHSSALYIGMAKVLPIIDVLGYDGQNSSFSSSPSHSDSTPHNSKRKSYINMKLCGYVGFCNAKRLVILTCL